MSFEMLMKNIYTFANILNQACSDTVKCWNDRSVQNAFNWASYCQQVHTQIRNKPFEEEMNTHIKGLTLHLSPPSCFELDFQSLQNAEALLTKVLMRNPLTPKNIIDFVLSRCQRLSLGFSELIQDCSVIGRELAALRMSEQMLESLQVDLGNCRIQAESNALLHTLVQQRQMSSSQERYETHVCGILQRLVADKYGWDLVLNLLLSEADCITKDFKGKGSNMFVLDNIHKITLSWISELVCTDTLPTRRLWATDSAVLCRVAAKHLSFCRLYLQYLVNCAKNLVIDYTHTNKHMYTWKITNSGEENVFIMDFGQLSRTFRLLLSTSRDENKAVVKQTLSSLAEQSFVNVFRDINGVLSDEI